MLTYRLLSVTPVSASSTSRPDYANHDVPQAGKPMCPQ